MLYRRARREPDSTGLEKGAINLWVVQVEPDYEAALRQLIARTNNNASDLSMTDVQMIVDAALEGTDDE